MKRKQFLAFGLFVLSFMANAQSDTMYFMKNGAVILKQSIKATDVDSVVFYKPQLQQANTFTDTRDGNTYETVTIGNKTWMAENLRYLPQVVGPATGSSTSPNYYVHGYNGTNVTTAKASANYATFGVLYNWPAAMAGSSSSSANPSGVQGVCPVGWHLPSEAEWDALTAILGGSATAGGKMKTTAGWNPPNAGATNESGFTALAGGSRRTDNSFGGIGNISPWWSTGQSSGSFAWVYLLIYQDAGVTKGNSSKAEGNYCRCVKN